MIEEIYSQIILEYANSNKNKKRIENASIIRKGINPSCGDEIEIFLLIEDNIIKEATYEGEGCAISKASTAILLNIIKDKTRKEAREVAELFLGIIRKEEKTEELKASELELLGDSIILKNIANMPARVKCATLAWNTLLKLLDEYNKDSNEEDLK